MRSNLDTSSINIIPKDVPGGVRNKTKENSLLGVSFELSSSLGRRKNPDATTKGAETRKVIPLLGG